MLNSFVWTPIKDLNQTYCFATITLRYVDFYSCIISKINLISIIIAILQFHHETVAIFCDPNISSPFCEEESNMCVQICSSKDDNDWKPKALIEAEIQRKGLAIHGIGYPACSNESYDLFSHDSSLTIQDDGTLYWGNIDFFE